MCVRVRMRVQSKEFAHMQTRTHERTYAPYSLSRICLSPFSPCLALTLTDTAQAVCDPSTSSRHGDRLEPLAQQRTLPPFISTSQPAAVTSTKRWPVTVVLFFASHASDNARVSLLVCVIEVRYCVVLRCARSPLTRRVLLAPQQAPGQQEAPCRPGAPAHKKQGGVTPARPDGLCHHALRYVAIALKS